MQTATLCKMSHLDCLERMDNYTMRTYLFYFFHFESQSRRCVAAYDIREWGIEDELMLFSLSTKHRAIYYISIWYMYTLTIQSLLLLFSLSLWCNMPVSVNLVIWLAPEIQYELSSEHVQNQTCPWLVACECSTLHVNHLQNKTTFFDVLRFFSASHQGRSMHASTDDGLVQVKKTNGEYIHTGYAPFQSTCYVSIRIPMLKELRIQPEQSA